MATESVSCGCIDFLTRCFYHPSQNVLTVQACFEHCLSEGRRRTRAKPSDLKAKWEQTVAKKGQEAAALKLIFNEIKITDNFLEAMKKFGFQICEVIKEFINDAEILTELPCILDAYLQLNKTLNMTITNNGSAKDMFIVLKKEQFLYNSIQRQKPVLTDDLIAAKNEFMMLISDKYQRTQSRQETISRLQPTPENIPKFQGSLDECFHHRTQSLKIYCTSAEKGGLCCDKCLTEEHRDCHEDAHVIIEKEANKFILTMDVQYETKHIQTFAKNVPAIDELCSKERNTTLDSIHTMMTISSEIDRVITEYEIDFAALKTLRDKLTQCAEFYIEIGTEWKMCTGKDSSADFICLQSEDFFLNWSLSFLPTLNVTEMKRDCFMARYEWWTFAYDQYKKHQQKKINPNDDGSNTSEGDKPCAKQVKPLPGRPSYEHYKEYGNTQERNADEQVQQQMQIEKTRQTEASKQMLYGVFGNFVSILEELELRIEKGDIKMPRSKIYLADQSYKSVEDVEGIVKGQLVAFGLQYKSCPSSIKSEVNTNLRMKTILWIAEREENEMGENRVDLYSCQLYEILVTQRTQHKEIEQPNEPPVLQDIMREAIPKILFGKHEAAILNEKFNADPSKKADIPQTRESGNTHAIDIGIERMKRIFKSYYSKESLTPFLESDRILFTKSTNTGLT